MARMKAVQATKPGGDWEMVERDIPQPQAGTGAPQSRSLRDLPQRYVREGGPLAWSSVPARAGT